MVMHDWKQEKQLEAAIRDLVRLAVERGSKATSRVTQTGSGKRQTEAKTIRVRIDPPIKR